MADDRRSRLKQWLESGEGQLHALTFPQRELWESSSVPVADPSNHICCLIFVRGLLTKIDCLEGVRRVVERQEVLRLSFLPGKEQPLQLVRKSADANLEFRDLGPEQDVEDIAQEIFSRPFDLIKGPLYRAAILRRAADDHVFAFACHHAIADGWTLGVFVHDLFAAYLQRATGNSGPLPSVPLSYTAWGAAERADWEPARLAGRANFWRTKLSGRRELWTTPSLPAPLCRWVSQIDAKQVSGIRELARQQGATLFSTLLATFQIALSEWTSCDDFVIGTPVANRNRPAVRETMGYCSGVVPLRAQVERKGSFSETLQQVHQHTVDAFANAMPFVELAQALEDRPAAGHHPIFQVRFALQNHPIPDVALPTLSANLRMRSTGTARFDLGCELTEMGADLEVVWLYRPVIFSRSAMEALDALLRNILAGVCRSPEKAVTSHLRAS